MNTQAVPSTQTSHSTGRIDTLWANLSAADKHVILGHSNPELSTTDRLKFVKVLTALGTQARRGRRPGPRTGALRRTSRR